MSQITICMRAFPVLVAALNFYKQKTEIVLLWSAVTINEKAIIQWVNAKKPQIPDYLTKRSRS